MPTPASLKVIPGSPPSRFVSQLLNLCGELESWRSDEKTAAKNSVRGFPPFEWKAGIQSLVFFITFLISSYSFRWVQSAHNIYATLAIVIAALISFPAAPILFIFQACGVAKGQFWRALFSFRSRPKDNYPFTPLATGLRYDAHHGIRLQRFRTETLKCMLNRISEEDSELRERLTVFVGTPTPLIVFGIIGGLFPAWESFHSHPGSVGQSALFFASIASLLVSLYGVHLRGALFELTRCRSLLSLEIARRSNARSNRYLEHAVQQYRESAGA